MLLPPVYLLKPFDQPRHQTLRMRPAPRGALTVMVKPVHGTIRIVASADAAARIRCLVRGPDHVLKCLNLRLLVKKLIEC